MKKLLEPAIITSIIIFVISLSFIPVINLSLKTPPNTIYTMPHNYILDYYIYLSYIAQGQQGNLLSYELHTSEPHQGSLSHVLYLASGWVTGPFNVPPFIVYQILRLFCSLFFAFSVYWFIALFFKKPKDRITAFFLSYASMGIPVITHLTQLDPIRRSAFLPHWTFENALFLIALGFIIKNKIIYAGIIIFFLNLFSPFHSVIILISYFILFIFDGANVFLSAQPDPMHQLMHGSEHFKKMFVSQKLRNLTILFLFFLPTFLYINLAYSSGPLAHIRIWESQQLENILYYFKNFVLDIGPTFILAPIGILILIFKKSLLPHISLISLITLTSYLFLFNINLDKSLGISNFRFLNIPVFVFLGIFSFYALSFLPKKFLLVLLIPLILLTLSSYSIIYKQISADNSNFPYNAFIPKDLYSGMIWLKNNTNHKNDIILSRYITGNMIPAVAGRRVYLGHQVSTINFSQKSASVEKFYTNKMTEKEAQEFLKDNNITYIFVGPEESPTFTPPKYPFLTTSFKNNSVVIYR